METQIFRTCFDVPETHLVGVLVEHRPEKRAACLHRDHQLRGRDVKVPLVARRVDLNFAYTPRFAVYWIREKSRGYSILFNTLMWRYLFDLTSVKFFRSVEFAKIGIDFYAHKYCMTSTKHDFVKAIKIDSVSDGTLIGEQNLPVDLMEHIVSTGDSDLIRRLPFGKIKDPRFGLMALNSGRFALCHFVDGYVSSDAVKATTLVTAWLESLAVVQIVTEIDRSVIKEIRARLRQYSIRPVFTNFAKVFELIPTAQQNDHNVAIDIVKSWGRRAASYELEALVESEWTFRLGGRAAKPRLSTTAPANKERTRI